MAETARSGDGIPIRYESLGSGSPALVFVHGWSCDRSYWREQVGHFSRQHEVVTVDLAGHGESGAGRSDWTMSAFGDDVLAVVEQLGLEKVVLVGHSMGGDVVLAAALQAPERVAGVVWVDVYSSLGHVRTADEIDAFVAPFRADFAATTTEFVRGMFLPTSDPGLVEWVASDMASAPPEVALGAIAHAVGHKHVVLRRLQELACPIVALNADYQPTDVDSLRQYGVEARVLPQVGHFLMLEDPNGFNRLLDETVAGFAD